MIDLILAVWSRPDTRSFLKRKDAKAQRSSQRHRVFLVGIDVSSRSNRCQVHGWPLNARDFEPRRHRSRKILMGCPGCRHLDTLNPRCRSGQIGAIQMGWNPLINCDVFVVVAFVVSVLFVVQRKTFKPHGGSHVESTFALQGEWCPLNNCDVFAPFAPWRFNSAMAAKGKSIHGCSQCKQHAK